MYLSKPCSFDLETLKKIKNWQVKNGVDNFSLAVRHLVEIGLSTRNNGVGVLQKKLLTTVPDIFDEVLEEQGLKKTKFLKRD